MLVLSPIKKILKEKSPTYFFDLFILYIFHSLIILSNILVIIFIPKMKIYK